jgi:hypothetical protein
VNSFIDQHINTGANLINADDPPSLCCAEMDTADDVDILRPMMPSAGATVALEEEMPLEAIMTLPL